PARGPPLFAATRIFSAWSVGAGRSCQFEVWEPGAGVAPGHGQTRRTWVWSRAWLLARGCRRADLLQADLGVAVRDPALFVVAGRAAAVRDENLLEPTLVATELVASCRTPSAVCVRASRAFLCVFDRQIAD